MKKITIAVDGHSSCGKSTLAQSLAKALGYIYIDSGAMYRAVTYFFLKENVDLDNASAIEQALKKITISFEKTSSNKNRTLLNGQDIEDEIRKMEVSNNVSKVATISIVRREMVKQQRAIGKRKGIVMDGRDIGTVVFKDAELKIFLTADVKIRTQRRLDEMKAKGLDISFEEVKTNLITRDHIDSTRKDSPLKKAKDAISIDNTSLTPKGQLKMALALYVEALKNNN